MAQFIKKVVFNTDLNADSIEWCPIKPYRHVFTCGTYQLSNAENMKEGEKKNPQELRKGQIYLFQLVTGPEVIKQIQKIPLVGVLDCKWAHRELSNNIFLAVATALGDIRIYKLQDIGLLSLEHVYTHPLSSSKSTLALSLDWSTGISDTDVKILISDSEGFITMVSFADGQIREDCKWKLHDFQAWIVAFNYWNPNVFYSGGDDCQLYIYDRRSDKVGRNDKAHSAGITSMHMNLKQEFSLVSGSYDEKVAFWDVRQMDQPKDLLNTGGGVWRLKWEPKNCEDIAAACMHNGFAVIDGPRCSILAEYKDHSSLAYGMDWSHLEEEELHKYFDMNKYSDKKVNVLAMCSFYDNLLSLALFQKDK